MRKVAAILVFLASSAGFAAPGLQSMNCNLSNGVILTTEDVLLDGLVVTSHWGLLTRDFKAVLDLKPSDGHYSIHLLNEKSETEYVVYLPLNLKLKNDQTVLGTVGAPDLFVANVICDLKLSRR